MKPHLPECPIADQRPYQNTESKDEKTNSGSICGYCANVSDIKVITDLRQCLMFDKLDVGKATHIMYAYHCSYIYCTCYI